MRRNVVAAVGIVTLAGALAVWDGGSMPSGSLVGSGGTGSTASSHRAALQSFDACDELTGWLARNSEPYVGPWGLQVGWSGGWGRATAEGDGGGEGLAAVAAPTDPARAGGTPAFSGTNVQEVGVDEPDTVKTDGNRLFTVRDGELVHIDLTGEEPRVAGTHAIGAPDRPQQADLLLAGDRLLVTWTSWTEQPALQGDTIAPGEPGSSRAAPRWPQTHAALFDVAGDAPRLLESARLDGTLVSGRLHGDTARLVLSNQAMRLPLVVPRTDRLGDLEAATRANVAALRDATPAQWLPWMSVTDRTGATPITSERPMTRCEDVHHTGEFAGTGTLDVLTVPLAGSIADAHATSILTGAETVYASNDRLYVTTYTWPQAQPGPAVLRRGPGPDARAVAPAPDDFTTAVHAFDVTDPASTSYLGSGEVPGHVLNQFSLSEHDGHLRVATTTGAPWAGGTESGVHVLRLDDGNLTRVGSVRDLGRGERIYAVRYVGDTGYVVTFRQVDPLYTLDLSDPSAPRVVGELKIPGYSAYLHPVGEGLLLGVGQDATDEGRVLGTQVSLFDVRDPASPRQVAKTVITDGSSAAEFDHHAFLHWPATGLTIVPVTAWSGQPWSAAMAFRVEGTALTRVGELSHADTAAVPGRDPWLVVEQAAIVRSLVVGDTVLTLSQAGLMTSDLDTLTTRHWLSLR